MSLRIALDLDDTVFAFISAYNRYFGVQLSKQKQRTITKNVYKLRNNKHFWENLDLLEAPDFEPCIYATKRINSKTYTRNNLKKFGLPVKPIYQIYIQSGNKADIIKGRCDVLIDDSVFNAKQALAKGLPAIVINRPHNLSDDFPYRVNSLTLDEIQKVYERQISEWNLVQLRYYQI